MKIAIINSFYYPDEPGGAERSVRHLAETLVEIGHQVTVICLGEKRESIQHGGVQIERLTIRNIYLPNSLGLQPSWLARIVWHIRDIQNKSAAYDIGALLDFIKPDVLHTNNLSGLSVSAWAVANSLNIPIVHTARDFYLMCPKSTMMHGARSCNVPCASCKPFAIPKRFYSKFVGHVVGISNFVLNRHLGNGFFCAAKRSVIYNSFDGVNVSYRSPSREIQIGYIGRLVPAKGVELLIKAFSQLAQNSKYQLRLLIAGSGRDDYVESLMACAKGLPVEFLGEQEPEEFFNRIDMTVVPSVWEEPLGRVVIESIIFGKPVVATPVGGIPELIEPEYGVLSKDVSVSALADAISSLLVRLEDDPERLFKAAIHSGQRFSRKIVANLYEKTYSELSKGYCQ